MQKIFLFPILLFQLTSLFGQNKDCPDANNCNGASGIKRCWGVVRTFDQGLQIRVQGPIEDCYNAINSETKAHSLRWHIEITGLKRVKQDCKLYVVGGDNRKTDFMIVSNEGGGVLTDKMNVDFLTFSNAETIGLEILPTNNTSANKNSNQQTSPQNDLTEYNRSKAEMEQKVQEENERRQQQATQLNNQRQQFINVYNEGVQLGNTGKYAEAAAKYQQAIGLATNDADRQNAQNAYNKFSRANQKTQAINQLSQATISIIGSIQEGARKRKEQKQQLEADQNQQKIDNFNNNKDYYNGVISMENEELGYYADYAAYKFDKLGYKLSENPNALEVSTPPHTEMRNSKRWSMVFVKEKDTVVVSVEATLTDFNKGTLNMYNKFERKLYIYSRTNSGLTSKENLKDIYIQMFGNVTKDISATGSLITGELSIEPAMVKNETAGIDFSNSSYKGHKIEFAKATTLDSAKNIEAYKSNGRKYYSGLTGKTSDYDDAIDWYSKAALLADTFSLNMMAELYEKKGRENPENFGNAMRLYKIIANYNSEFSTNAMLSIGKMYENGDGTPKDCVLAIQWYEGAANAKNTNSILGYMYLKRIFSKYGCHPDKQLEKEWLEKLCIFAPDNSFCK